MTDELDDTFEGPEEGYSDFDYAQGPYRRGYFGEWERRRYLHPRDYDRMPGRRWDEDYGANRARYGQPYRADETYEYQPPRRGGVYAGAYPAPSGRRPRGSRGRRGPRRHYESGRWHGRPPRRGPSRQSGSGGEYEVGSGPYGRPYRDEYAGEPREAATSGLDDYRPGYQARRSGREGGWRAPGPHSGRGPANYQRSPLRIEEEACERLTQHGWIDASDIQVAVEDGVITLSGKVADRRQKRLAEDAVESVMGVYDVQNRLTIPRPGQAETEEG